MIGQSQQEQKRRLEERLARRRQLQAERESQGLAVDEQTLDEIQDEEEREENAKRKVSVVYVIRFFCLLGFLYVPAKGKIYRWDRYHKTFLHLLNAIFF